MKLKELYKKFNMIIKYFLCSVSSSIIDFAILYMLKGVFDEIVVANTISIIVSSIFHYIVTSNYVFKVKKNIYSIVIYVVTFFIGLSIQNFVIWVTYTKLFVTLIENDMILTLLSKVLSLGASFIITYMLRKFLNARLKKKEQRVK